MLINNIKCIVLDTQQYLKQIVNLKNKVLTNQYKDRQEFTIIYEKINDLDINHCYGMLIFRTSLCTNNVHGKYHKNEK